MSDESAIREIVAARCAAMGRGDAQAIVDQYVVDPVVYSLAPPLRQPKDGTRDVAALQEWFEGKGGSVRAEVRDLEVTVGGDVAFCTALESMGSPDGAPGPAFTLWYRTTLGLRRVDGRWLIAHEHTSTPFYMDGSLRAALDLVP